MESENRDVSTALKMTKKKKLLIKAKALPILDPGVLNRTGGRGPARPGSRRAPKIKCRIIATSRAITRWVGYRIFRRGITVAIVGHERARRSIPVAKRIVKIGICTGRIRTKHRLLQRAAKIVARVRTTRCRRIAIGIAAELDIQII